MKILLQVEDEQLIMIRFAWPGPNIRLKKVLFIRLKDNKHMFVVAEVDIRACKVEKKYMP